VRSKFAVTQSWLAALAASAIAATVLVGACSTRLPPSASPSPPTASPSPSLTPVPTELVDPADFRPSVVAFFDPDHGLAGGSIGSGDAARGAVASTADGGVSWTIRTQILAPVGDLAIAGNEAWTLIPCRDGPDPLCGKLLHSADAGETWDLLPATGAVAPGAGTISFVDASTGWAIGAARPPDGTVPGHGRNRLLQTSDGGLTWSAGPIPCGTDWQDLSSVQFIDTQHGWAVCTGEGSGTMAPTQVLETVDGGVDWMTRSSASSFARPGRLVGQPPSGPVEGAFFTPGGLGWVWQGRSGTARSRDGGRTWTASGPARAEEEFVSSMWFVSETEGFAVYSSTETQELVLAATHDGGDRWRMIQTWPIR